MGHAKDGRAALSHAGPGGGASSSFMSWSFLSSALPRPLLRRVVCCAAGVVALAFAAAAAADDDGSCCCCSSHHSTRRHSLVGPEKQVSSQSNWNTIQVHNS